MDRSSSPDRWLFQALSHSSASLLSLWMLAVALWFPGAAFAKDIQTQIETQSGEPVVVSAWEATAEGIVAPGDSRQVIGWDDFVSLRTTSDAEDWSRRTSMIWLANGDQLVAEPVTISDDTLTVRWVQHPDRETWDIPLEQVSALWIKTPGTPSGRLRLIREAAFESRKSDVAWLISGDRVAGEFTGLQSGEFRFSTSAGALPILQEKLLALKFDPDLVSKAKPLDTRSVLTLRDGSRLTATRWERVQDRLTMVTPWKTELRIPSNSLLECRRYSPRLQPLSEREPESVETARYLGGTWTSSRNANVLGGPLQLRGREYALGLGTHSRTAMTFSLEPQDRQFRAVIGIDDLADGRGHAVFEVLLDGRSVWTSPAVTGKSDPLVIKPIDVRGRKQLTLISHFGEGGDVSDLANWCDPVLLRDP